jgi:pimaricinolide synthase PimS1
MTAVDQAADGFAVIGVSCRFPGARNPAELWRLLCSGEPALANIPDGRWDQTFLDGLDPTESKTVRRGGFLPDVSSFDSGFFDISPREPARMDPQQRLLLELSWEALDDAQMTRAQVEGMDAGVYVGVSSDDYSALIRAHGPKAINAHTLTGSLRGVVANRVSHHFGLTGPSMAIDAGQASSLVAVHLAAESLRREESSIAIVGGVTLRLTPHHSLAAHRFGALSPDGRSFVFDARANGFGQGEGGGVVILKPLAAALADHNRICCVVRGSAVNNEGASAQLGVPSSRSQAALLRATHRRAGVAARDFVYVELHGTGTPAGDPVEAAALADVIGAERDPGDPLRVGSTKSTIGHLEAAAGIAGLIKTALCLREGTLVPSAGFQSPPARIPLDDWNLRVQTAVEPIPADDGVVVGISSFGIGGTNCHVAVSAPPRSREDDTPRQRHRVDDDRRLARETRSTRIVSCQRRCASAVGHRSCRSDQGRRGRRADGVVAGHPTDVVGSSSSGHGCEPRHVRRSPGRPEVHRRRRSLVTGEPGHGTPVRKRTRGIRLPGARLWMDRHDSAVAGRVTGFRGRDPAVR